MTTTTPAQFEATESVFVARQPIMDGNMRTWGYELLFRQNAESDTAVITDGNAATSQVIVDGYNMAREWLRNGQKILINYPTDMLLQGAPRVLPPEVAVVEILETVDITPELVDACAELKSEGYVLALDDYIGTPGFEPLLDLVDLVKVDVLGIPRLRLGMILRSLERHRCTLLAERVEDMGTFHIGRGLGCDLFQGFFFSRPELMAGKKLSANERSKLQLLQELGSSDLDLARISKIIQTDLSLSYRLLRYINSPGVGLRHEVKSIAQAVNLLGQRKISAWLRVLILADMNPSPRTHELLFFSLQRARFYELMALSRNGDILPADSMFLFGLLSFLDAILARPMETIVPGLALEPRLTNALLGQDEGLHPWMELSQACECGKWAQADDILVRMGVSPRDTAKHFNAATLWARKFLDMT